MSTARPPEGARTEGEAEGTPVSTAGPPRGAQHRSAQREQTPVRTPLLEVTGLRKRYPLAASGAARGLRLPWQPRPQLHAVDDLQLTLQPGEALGLVGESGSGKSTTASLIARLQDPDGGRILFEGQDIATVAARHAARAPWRGRIQMVFQDAVDSLDPRAHAYEAIAAPLRRLTPLRGAALQARVHEAAGRAHLPRALLSHYPHQLSGGQAARVGIARAIALRPALLILDEPTSALDVSVQVGVLQLLDTLRRESGMGYLFVSHDLQVVRLLCQRVLVMQHGRVVESGPTAQVLDAPTHPYAQRLAAAIPTLAPLSTPAASPVSAAFAGTSTPDPLP